MNNDITPESAIQEIIQWTKQCYADPKGGVFRSIDQQCRPSKEHIFNDLGDYLPFFTYLKEDEFCRRQLNDVVAVLNPTGLLPGDFRYIGFTCTRSYEHTDLLLGLLDGYMCYPTEELRLLIYKTLQSVRDKYHPEKSYYSSWYFPGINYRFPIFDFKDGMFIEIWVTAYRIFHDVKFLEIASGLADKITEKIHKDPNGFIPEVQGTNRLGDIFIKYYFRNNRYRYTPVKYIVNTAWGFLELFNETRDKRYLEALNKIKDNIKQNLVGENGAVFQVVYNSRKHRIMPAQLVNNFSVIDWSVDCAYFLQDKSYLELAESVAAPWIEMQDAFTGLIPQNIGGQNTYFDSLTDMSIALFKLSELTGNADYRIRAERIVFALLKYHRQPESCGYALAVDAKSGAVVDPQQKVKFICLFLKALIVMKERKPIYGTELYELTKDR